MRRAAGPSAQIREEHYFTDGPFRTSNANGQAKRGKRNPLPTTCSSTTTSPLAIVEAKDNKHSLGAAACSRLYTTPRYWTSPSPTAPTATASSSTTALMARASSERELPLNAFPHPGEALWARYNKHNDISP